mmetsp:Transcript_12505/g.15688  ORF Transcript_12505/g.15688 Transcript_12505/m.15688 type:complete len:885 (-) Transcript_12505:269-2923(-)|eukprot:CAMPEP_0172494330 /NCGR_PEP_ID=MMETSP1066-20121228/45233_1 /TAXON_ID=671091 /ORGANISM="Coscinodiscus wailesii, Strain CCMP2513" /LENGTH=884 /DNA_ID=CAMNT_0013265223 /DNA_START=129 /DNA_END=2783 /DNA_ORIENTATION=-
MSADTEEKASASTISAVHNTGRAVTSELTESAYSAPSNFLVPQNPDLAHNCARAATRNESSDAGEMTSPACLSETVEDEVVVFQGGGAISSSHACSPDTNAHGENTTDIITSSDFIPVASATGTVSLGLGTSNVNFGKHSGSLDSGISPTFHPRVVTTNSNNTIVSTPVGSTFSISSRGYTSVTAASSTSSTSSTASTSTNQTRPWNNATAGATAANNTNRSMMNHYQYPYPSSATPVTTATVRKPPPPTNGSAPLPQLHSKQQAAISVSSSTLGSETSGTVDRIDSALLSALCDQRERKGLLRLEQVLIDFMNERNTGFIEVGGPNNSIVIGGQTGGRLSQTNGEEVRGRQTSFQRLCLHRLADRFNIVRESSSSVWTTPQGGAGDEYLPPVSCPSPSGSIMPGLIRLVKVKSSRIPPNLLIDLDVEKIDASKEGDQGDGTVRTITDNLAQTNITQNGDVVVVGRRGNQQPRRKMMIMKRGSSRSISSGSDRDSRHQSQGGGRNSIRGKNLSDKEKAYAEARARIFKDDAEYAAGYDEKKQTVSMAGTTITEAAPSADGVEPLSSIPISTSLRGYTAFSSSVRSISPASSSAKGGSDGAVEPVDNDRASSITLESTSTTQEAPEQDPDSPSKVGGRLKDTQASGPAAASSTNGAMSKVIWRNRRQEENDPDFRRGVVRPSGGMAPMQTLPQMHYGGGHGGAVFVASAPLSAPSSYGGHHNMSDSSFAMLQQQSKSAASNSHYHHSQQSHHYYGSSQQQHAPSSHHQYSSNNSNRHHSYVVQQQQPAAAAYYAQHRQSNPSSGSFFSQQNQDHQVLQQRQHYHHTRVSANRGNYVTSSGNPQGIHHHGMFYSTGNNNAGSTASTGRRGSDGAAIYSMEEFPALR